MDDAYQPIDCNVHDQLLERATFGRPTEITYRNDQGGLVVCRDVIEDVFSRSGSEYLRLRAGIEIRLDKVIRFGDVGEGCGVWRVGTDAERDGT